MSDERISFSRDASATTKAAIAERLRANPRTVPRAIYQAANADLAVEARRLAFTSNRSYDDAAAHLAATDAWLGLGVQSYIEGPSADRLLGEIGVEVAS